MSADEGVIVMMDDYEDGYEAAMEQTNSFNYEPPVFNREIYCWRCHRELSPEFGYYCFDCMQDCWATPGYWGA
jgi:hypothetical protein